ncbi:MAG: hypothetical protein N2512_08580 [Armatimonadetes bacterium]|nr:hypothetical protein [Armatimonadota bacterium]
MAEGAQDKRYFNQAVSNAAHAAIAANDALCLFLTSRRPAGKSHAQAAAALQDACKGTRWAQEAPQRAKQFTDVLQPKNRAEYYGEPIDEETAERVVKQARRFLEWVEGTTQIT